jgi:peptide chain release factor 1
MNVLRARLLAIEQSKQREEIESSRRSQVGSGERAEKIRTYNFPQDRMTDHRVNYTRHGLPQLLDGDMDDVIEALLEDEQKRRLDEQLGDEAA